MAVPTITRQPESQTVVVGQTARFEVEASGDGLEYRWRRNDQEVEGASARSYAFTAQPSDSGAAFSALVSNAEGRRLSDPATLTVVGEVPLLFDPRFAIGAGAVLLAVFLLALWPLWVMGARVSGASMNGVPAFSGVIAVMLMIIGVLVTLAGVFLILLEFRGRSRTLAEMRPAPRGDGRLGPAEELAKSLPETLKAFGQLKAPASILVVAAVLFICATVIAWRALPDPASATSPTSPPSVTSTT
jgi:hypothetical protein